MGIGEEKMDVHIGDENGPALNRLDPNIFSHCTYLHTASSPVLEHGRGALHDVGQAGEDEPPARDERDGVRQTRAQPEMQVLNQHLLERLKSRKSIRDYVF